jgi:hypothetical protein
MRIPTQMVIYGFWIFAVVFALTLIGSALLVGLRGEWSVSRWRMIKLFSALLGAVGIVMLLLNFEATVRNAIVEKGKEYAFAEFLDLKFFITQAVVLACAKDQTIERNRLTCFDFKNIDGQVSSYWVRTSKGINKITNWQYNSGIEEFVAEVNRRLAYINNALPPADEDREIVSSKTRIDLLMLAVLLVTTAIAGAVGDAAFQVRLSLNEREVQVG